MINQNLELLESYNKLNPNRQLTLEEHLYHLELIKDFKPYTILENGFIQYGNYQFNPKTKTYYIEKFGIEKGLYERKDIKYRMKKQYEKINENNPYSRLTSKEFYTIFEL